MLLPWTLATLLAVIDVHGGGACPSAAEVTRAQEALGAGQRSECRAPGDAGQLTVVTWAEQRRIFARVALRRRVCRRARWQQ